jgi:hypothetical protein
MVVPFHVLHFFCFIVIDIEVLILFSQHIPLFVVPLLCLLTVDVRWLNTKVNLLTNVVGFFPKQTTSSQVYLYLYSIP